jgi:hypothetical protein
MRRKTSSSTRALRKFQVVLASSLGATLAASPQALAQDEGGAPSGGDAQGGSPVVQVPTTTTTTEVVVPGYPSPGTNLDAHLLSGSQSTTDTSQSRDDFDFAPGGGGGTVRGSETGAFVVDGTFVPEVHSVRRGDTLWEISEAYTKNAYNWPRIWALNPQIQNPHWIYPGDRVRLRTESEALRGSEGRGPSRRRAVPLETVFLRDVGWIDDPGRDAWGEITGSPDDQMLLSEGDSIYARLDGKGDVAVGDELSIFRPIREVKGAGGQLVSIRGTVKVERYNPKTKMLRAKIVEALDVIERGAKIGPVGRRFEVVPPATNENDVEARIVASVYPLQLYGQNQVVFLDRGEKDGLAPGNRLLAIRRGDRWRDEIGAAGKLARKRARVEDDEPAEVDDMLVDQDEDLLPDETYAELRVIHVRDHSAMALVTASTSEVERGARVVARKGY